LGQRVAVIEAGVKEPGTHQTKWNAQTEAGQKLPSGIYICRLKAGDRSFDMKMVLLQ
jgi:flagellar hook assembly protein FlgD